jgi:hypothetical protein
MNSNLPIKKKVRQKQRQMENNAMQIRSYLVAARMASVYLFVLTPLILGGCKSEFNTVDYSKLPEYPSDDVKLYIEKCGSCHGAPQPSVHVEKDWPGVMNRMRFRMTSKKVVPLNKDESATILDYLQRNAK